MIRWVEGELCYFLMGTKLGGSTKKLDYIFFALSITSSPSSQVNYGLSQERLPPRMAKV